MKAGTIALFAALVVSGVFQLTAVQPASAGEQTVMIETQSFAPQVMTVHVGDRVTWSNRDHTEHFLTSSGPMTRSVATQVGDLEFHQRMIPGSDYSHSFKSPGVYGYFCAIHMGMWGTIVVEP
ncbi:MAG TPA: plastocyanin/azurin family copper-binding protein [Nitrospiria bacterium]|nr:plastocyanin/azurin family copper-binding protein [Nitrospiria bacterium]